MIRLLALETATDRGSFCLWSGAGTGEGAASPQTCETINCPAGQPHAETLLPLLKTSLAELGWALSDLDAIVYDAGPGMFTGLRVSAALAQGLGLALDKPLVAVSSLEALAEAAYQQTGATQVLSLLDARMNQVYASRWQRQPDGFWQTDLSACLMNPDAINASPDLLTLSNGMAVVAGTALAVYPQLAADCAAAGWLDSGVRYPVADALAHVGAGRYLRGERQDPADAVPIYVRDRVALTTVERLAGETL